MGDYKTVKTVAELDAKSPDNRALPVMPAYNFVVMKALSNAAAAMLKESREYKEGMSKIAKLVSSLSFGKKLALGAAGFGIAALIDLFGGGTDGGLNLEMIKTAIRTELMDHETQKMTGKFERAVEIFFKESPGIKNKKARAEKCAEAESMLGKQISIAKNLLTGSWKDSHTKLYVLMQSMMSTRLAVLEWQQSHDKERRLTKDKLESVTKDYAAAAKGMLPEYIKYRQARVDTGKIATLYDPETGYTDYQWIVYDSHSKRKLEDSERACKRLRREYETHLEQTYTAANKVW